MKFQRPRQTQIVKTQASLILIGLFCVCLPVLAETTEPTGSASPRSDPTRTEAPRKPETSSTSSIPSEPRPQEPVTASFAPLNRTSNITSSVPPQTAAPSADPARNASEEPPRETQRDPSQATGASTNRATENANSTAERNAPTERTLAPEKLRTDLSVSGSPASSLPLLAGDTANQMQKEPIPLVLYHEWLVTSTSMQAAQQEHKLLSPFGLKIKRRQHLPKLGFVISVYRLPEHLDAQALFDKVSAQFPELNIEFNQRYPLLSGQQSQTINVKHYGQHITGIAMEGCSAFQGQLAIMDSRVNPELPEFSHFKLTAIDLPLLKNEAVSDHGTAVAYLFSQLLPNASLVVINVYKLTDGNLETRSDWLINGFELVLSQQPLPLVLNMSFGGNPSDLLKRALDSLAQSNIRLVAAAGNGGEHASAVYPAAYANVVAVSALDIKENLWEQSNRGDYLQFAAPGVDLWLLGAKGKKRYMSGTSFAAPWVSALAALTNDSQWQQPASLAKDLGSAGFDSHFGFGLVQFKNRCKS